MQSAFDNPADASARERARFERIASELERIATWLRSRDPNSEQADRLRQRGLYIRADSQFPRE